MQLNSLPAHPLSHRLRATRTRTCSKCAARSTTPDPAGQRFRLPSWIPGSYLIREFARHFVTRARGSGRRGGGDRQGSEGPLARGALRRTADRRGRRLRVRLLGARGVPRRDFAAISTAPSVFLCPEGRADAPCEVEIVAPEGAAYRSVACRDDVAERRRRAVGLRRVPRGRLRRADRPSGGDGGFPGGVVRGRRRDARHRDHRQGPRAISTASRRISRASASGRSISSAARRGAGRRSTAICSRSPRSATATAGSSIARARAFAASATSCRRRAWRGVTDDYRRFLGLASHEYFHSWNVKRIKPAAFVPYDLARESYTRQLWAFEGITSYYDDLALVRSGVIDAAELSRAPRAGHHRRAARSRAGTSRASPNRASMRGSSSTGGTRTRRTPSSATTPRARSSRSRSISRCAARRVARRPDARSCGSATAQTGIGVPEDGIEAIATELAGADLVGLLRALRARHRGSAARGAARRIRRHAQPAARRRATRIAAASPAAARTTTSRRRGWLGAEPRRRRRGDAAARLHRRAGGARGTRRRRRRRRHRRPARVGRRDRKAAAPAARGRDADRARVPARRADRDRADARRGAGRHLLARRSTRGVDDATRARRAAWLGGDGVARLRYSVTVGIERVAAGHGGLGEHVAGHRLARRRRR